MSKLITFEILPVEKWPLVAPTVREEFGNSMPVTSLQSTFLAALEGDKLAGFIHVESLLNLNSIYVAPEHRRTRLPWRLITECDARLAQMRGFSAIAFPDYESHTKMYERFGGRKLDTPFGVWRKDY